VGKRARRASNASNGASLITIIPLVCRYPRTIGEPFLPSVLNSPMRTPSATPFPIAVCHCAHNIICVLVFQGGADREKSFTGAAQSPILKKLVSVFDFSCFLILRKTIVLFRTRRVLSVITLVTHVCLPFAWEVTLWSTRSDATLAFPISSVPILLLLKDKVCYYFNIIAVKKIESENFALSFFLLEYITNNPFSNLRHKEL